jgi:hypothetical protein
LLKINGIEDISYHSHVFHCPLFGFTQLSSQHSISSFFNFI